MHTAMNFFGCYVLALAFTVATPFGLAVEVDTPKDGRQFPSLGFAVPAFGFLNTLNQGNIFAKSTVTRTVVSTVSTVTVPSWRTCTTTMAGAFPACAGRRRRGASNQEDELIEHTPVIKVIIGKTEISDPAAVAEILHLNKSPNFKDSETEASTLSYLPRRSGEAEDTTTILYSSLDVEESVSSESEVFADDSSTLSTTETPYFADDVAQDSTTAGILTNEDEKGRLGVGGGASTSTSTIAVTHVVSTAVTVEKSTLTVQYGGCSPAGPLPIIAPACPA